MSDKASKAFDPHWYASRYPDVGLSGLSPREHYRRFGRLMGRSANGDDASQIEVRKAPSSEAPPESPQEAVGTKKSPVASAIETPAIVDRPNDLDLSLTQPIAVKHLTGEPLSLRDFQREPAISACARLLRLEQGVENQGSPSCAASIFQSGATRIDSIWYAGRSRLRLMICGNSDAGGDAEPPVLRFYQPDPANSGSLSQVGEAVQLPRVGPAFHDAELLHPLMPLVLELSDVEATSRSFALVPFPSLLPGGLHWAELKANQTEANPMDDFWARSETLLQDAVGQAAGTPRSITRISNSPVWTGGSEEIRGDLESWLNALFGLSLSNGGEAGKSVKGIELSLPADFIPTVSSLVSRDLEAGNRGHRVGPYLVAEEGSHRPRWSIVLPQLAAPWADAPHLRGPVRKGSAVSDAAATHLAIALRAPKAAGKKQAAAAGLQSAERIARPVSVLIDGSDTGKTELLSATLREVLGPEVELLIRPGGADIREIAQSARHDLLLTVSDRVRLDDPHALPMLVAMLEDDRTGSASCLLLGEKVMKRQTVLQPGSGGLFPAGVSFASAPRLSFYEPDVADALPGMTYPVAANTMLLTLFRRQALAALQRPSAPVPAAAADIRVGLDLMRAGFSNWCTTRVTATITGEHVRRDCIDPVGEDYARPGHWEEILGKVTLVRELF